MKTTTMNWVKPLCLCLLLGTGNALVEPRRRIPTDSARQGLRMHMSLPSIRGFRLPVASQQKNKPTKELWYRDRSAAEEQMTTQMAPNLATTSTRPTTTPAMRVDDWNPFGAVNLPMVQATCLSHASLLMGGSTVLSLALLFNPESASLDWSSLHWNGDAATPFHSLMDWSMSPVRASEGILATIPLVALSSVMCNSEDLMCPIHVSLTNTVQSLFGRREDANIDTNKGTNPRTVKLVSLGIGSVSALSEELVFRGLLPTVLVAYTHSVELALVGQALLFGMGQIRRQSSVAENGVFSLMQSMNGLWYGMVYLGTGGDILPVLVAHILYECHVFVGGWKMINDQLDYTHETLNHQVSPSQQMELDTIEKEAGGSLKPEILDHCRKFFYAFDCDHRGSLSRADVKRAVVYAFLQDDPVNKPSDARTSAAFDEIIQERPEETQEEEEDRIGLSEFLHLLFALESKTWSNPQLA